MEPEEPEQTRDVEAEFVALLTSGQAAIAVVVRALMPGEANYRRGGPADQCEAVGKTYRV